MQILLLNATDSGGAGVATIRLYNALKNLGADVKVIFLKVKKAENQSNPDFYPINESATHKALYFFRHRMEQVRLSIAGLPKDFSTGAFGNQLQHHPWVKQADILHLHWINDNFLPIDFLTKVKKPVFWTFHDMWPISGGFHYMPEADLALTPGQAGFTALPRAYRLLWKMKQRIYNKTHLHAVCPSNWLAKLANESVLLQNKAISTIPNPIDTNVFKPLNKYVLRQNLGLADDQKTILFGSFNVLADERKGFHFLKKALFSFHAANTELSAKTTVLVLGKEDKSLADDLPFEVKFLGFKTIDREIVEAYNLADVLVLPSLQDNLPNMCMEALACGVPVVAFDIGGIGDMVQHGLNGYLCESKNSDQMAEGIAKLLGDDALRQENSLYARAFVKAHFSEKIVGKQMMILYQQAMNTHD